MQLKRTSLAQVTAGMLLATSLVGSALAQRIPASSQDSGRRAIVAIDQASIINNINNAQNTANYAVGVGSNAQGTADYAVRVAQDAATRTSHGSVITSWTYSGGQAAWSAFGLCLQGWNPDGAALYTSNRPCPAGSGPYVISATQNGGGNGE